MQEIISPARLQQSLTHPEHSVNPYSEFISTVSLSRLKICGEITETAPPLTCTTWPYRVVVSFLPHNFTPRVGITDRSYARAAVIVGCASRWRALFACN
jgi:hypothetical protein